MSTPEHFTRGDRIEVIACADHDPIPPGSTGTVRRWNPSARQLNVDWDPLNAHRRPVLVIPTATR